MIAQIGINPAVEFGENLNLAVFDNRLFVDPYNIFPNDNRVTTSAGRRPRKLPVKLAATKVEPSSAGQDGESLFWF
jgi:hypothetical protein